LETLLKKRDVNIEDLRYKIFKLDTLMRNITDIDPTTLTNKYVELLKFEDINLVDDEDEYIKTRLIERSINADKYKIGKYTNQIYFILDGIFKVDYMKKKKSIDLIEDFIELMRLPIKINKLFIDLYSERNKDFIEHFKKYPNDPITSRRFWSTSLSEKIASSDFFTDKKECCLLTIEIPKGAHAIYINGLNNEAEILVAPCVEYKLLDHNEKENTMKLKYVNAKKENTKEDWELFKEVIRLKVIREVVLSHDDKLIMVQNFNVVEEKLIKKMKEYLAC